MSIPQGMASLSRDPSRLSLHGLKGDQRSETGESFYKSDKPSGIPVATGRPGSGNPVTSRPPQGQGRQKPGTNIPHRFLTPAEWARVAHGLGAIREGETHQVVHPSSWYWPPKGLPEGLYRDIVTQRTKYFYSYHILSVLRWLLMLLQIILGAVLTALGSFQTTDGTPVTVLAAINTVDAGILALMHNSGLPDRYRLDKVEFVKVEDFLKELLDTGIVEQHQTVDDILSDCFARYQKAKSIVLANMPESYTTQAAPWIGEKAPMICPDPSAHFVMSVQPQSQPSQDKQ
ncbi:uncharacterized protein QC761_122810 [Podospora bellae-mahoneyi]|uniref:SMODS and SLOG-associating 2TM effector domain-containing protein n=1 Tax=Podospora bellae-mahoneyi TaxID=2093777 RepID=A0ABR0FT95_9PEZI|nr:hypothetical protein QC761_122810 [Podospora bellae-mahoneyi]